MTLRHRIAIFPSAAILTIVAVRGLLQFVAPGSEKPAAVACLIGLGLPAIWTRSDRGLAILAAGLATVLGTGVYLWPHSYSVRVGSVAISRQEVTTSIGHDQAGLLVVGVVLVAAACGWFLFVQREPWPLVALAGMAVLVRADISLDYEHYFPLFLMCALLVVVSPYAASTRRVGTAVATVGASCGVLLALWQVPTVSHAWAPGWLDPLHRAGRATTTSVAVPNSVDLRQTFHPSDAVVMRIRTNAPDLRPYWRGAVLDQFDGHSWTASSEIPQPLIAGQTVPAPALTNAATHTIVAAVRVFQPTTRLFAPGVPLRSSLQAIAVYSRTGDLEQLVSGQTIPGGGSYTVEASAGPAPVTDPAPYLQLPSEPARILELTRAIIGDAADSATAVARIAHYLRDSGRFTYDAGEASPSDADAVDTFLFETRRGFCNQFASALVVLAREDGIPARLVTGYTNGDYRQGISTVRDRDAHSWAEVYVPDRGWVDFDPTPGFRLKVHAGTGATNPPNPAVPGGPGVATLPSPPQPPRAISSPEAHRSGARHPRAGVPNLLYPLIPLALLIGVGYAVRPRSIPQLYRTVARSIRPNETPAEYLARLNTSAGSRADTELVIDLYTLQRYGGRIVSRDALRAARRAWWRLQVRRVLRRLPVRH